MSPLLAALAAAAISGGCHDEVLLRVAHERSDATPYVILTRSGRRLPILGQDFIDPRKWRREDPLRVCPDSEDARFARVTDKRRGETLVTSEAENPPPQPIPAR